jgi:hypothetical protein
MAGTVRYNNAIIYDCGQLPNARLGTPYVNQYGVQVIRPSKYGAYRAACVAVPTRTHATRTVNSYHIAQYDAADAPQPPAAVPGIRPPTWLLGRDILWGNGLAAWAENPPAWALGAPTLRCVTANKWVRQAGVAAPRFISDIDIYNGPNRMADATIDDYDNAKTQDNAKSLGFVLEFNNFRYYVAGDLERAQEDGADTIRANPSVFYPGVRQLLNPAGTAAGRVLAMKTSHHGAATASSRQFLTALRPSGAFISNGRRNKHRHPFSQTINSLDGYSEMPPTVAAGRRYGAAPPPPPLPPIQNYLTGYQNPTLAALLTLGGVASRTAGPPAGDVRLNVSEVQSQRDRRGQVYRGVAAALNQAVAQGLIALAAAQIDTIADSAVIQGPEAVAGLVLGAGPATCSAGAFKALEGADVINVAGAVTPGLVTAGVAAAGGGVAAATVAINAIGPGRAAAAGAGTTEVLSRVVTGATAANVIAGGVAAAPGNANGVNGAARAAVAVSATLNVAAAAYAALAAMGAGSTGATAGQAAAIGAVVGARSGGATVAQTVTVVRTAATAAGIAAGNATAAALAAAVAAHGGTPANVQAATFAALTANAVAAGPAGLAAGAAQAAATVAASDLFAVTYPAAAGVQNINHTG